MSGDLVERLRWECGQCPACDQVKRAAAARIEALEAERDTLAEMVRAARIKVRPTASGPWLNCESPDITPDQAERFRAVLDRIGEVRPKR